jgi:sugar fermentation stimulation protein A
MNMNSPHHKRRYFGHTLRTSFLRRPNRFLIQCKWKGRILSAFLPNPGRLHELLLAKRTIHLVREKTSQNRKTHYTAVAVEREGHPIMLHTYLTNEVARYLLQKGRIPGVEKARIVKSEIQLGRSRFDFLLKERGKDILLEVKSCTLVGGKKSLCSQML